MDMIGITPEQFIYNTMNWSPEKLAIMFMVGYERPNQNPIKNRYTYRQERATFWYNYVMGQVIVADYVARIAPFIRKKFIITSEFWEQPRVHKGLDISTGAEDTLYSMCTGEVIYVGYDANGYGNYLIMKEDGTGLGFLYGHLRDVPLVSQGSRIYKGQPVGIEGSTGHSTGIHLHLEMQDLSNRNWIYHGNREDYLNPAEFMNIPNTEGISAVYYGVSPIPPTPSFQYKKMNLSLYLKKKRKKGVDIIR